MRPVRALRVFDRSARERLCEAYDALLQEEFARSGATNQRVQDPDDTAPHGMLSCQILSVFSEYEPT